MSKEDFPLGAKCLKLCFYVVLNVGLCMICNVYLSKS